jgi:Ca-activated chloride channel family protein
MKHPLQLQLRSDHENLLHDAETIMHSIVEITAADQGIERERPPLSVVFVLDVSGSMNGEPIRQVIAATQRLIDMLRPDDRAGVVSFSTHASVIADVITADGESKAKLKRAVGDMRPLASTNMEAGLRLAQRVLPARRVHERQVLLLLSDGMPNQGVSHPDGLRALAAAMRPDITTSTLGFGVHHAEPILSAICEGGAGTYHYIRDPALSYVQFAHALGAQADIVAEKIELCVTPPDRVQVLASLGREKLRFSRNGVLIDLPDMIASGSYKLALRLAVKAPRETGLERLLDVSLKYQPAGASGYVFHEARLDVPVTRQPSRLKVAGVHDVLVLRATEERKRARDLADKRDFSAAAKLLRELVAMIEQAPGFKSDDGSMLAEAWDQLRDDADLYEQAPDESEYAEFRRGQRIGAGGDFFAGSKLAAQHGTRALVEDAAGPLPDASLVEVTSGKRFKLERAVNIIGRSSTCEIHVPSEKVSRQSAGIVAEGGRFWVEDLGSTNGVFKDGVRIKKHRLQNGDIIYVGDAGFRYESES